MTDKSSASPATLGSVACGLCGTPTRMTGTKRCDRCWELESRIHGAPKLAAKILAAFATSEIAQQEQCSYCGESYPKPISYHHSTEECHENEARNKLAAPKRDSAMEATIRALKVIHAGEPPYGNLPLEVMETCGNAADYLEAFPSATPTKSCPRCGYQEDE